MARASWRSPAAPSPGNNGTPLLRGYTWSSVRRRVLAMLDAGYIDPSALRTLVLDEADTLLNMGFEEEVHRIIKQLPSSSSGGDALRRQTLLFSATWPTKVEALSARVQSRPQIISDGDGDGDGDGGAAAAQ